MWAPRPVWQGCFFGVWYCMQAPDAVIGFPVNGASPELASPQVDSEARLAGHSGTPSPANLSDNPKESDNR
ncbi:hypothetical protein C8U37_11235 [Trichococcus patagoniensis]|uniref:Uncharacterized protein n=1 Tax=Trichococcus patagoniensis TaxID=382641 RepID=A0A2T5IIW2_9LACT|nr:hypothetical protein C8U37_11235 [Trichococcus patagoniensis]